MQEGFNTKETILDICKRTIHRDGVVELLDWLENKSDFFVAPASTRFHGSYAGGLAEHSLNVYNELKKLLSLYELDSDYSDETVSIVSLFHDLCKTNYYKIGKKNVKNAETGKWESVDAYEVDERYPLGDHSDKSIFIIQHFMRLEPEEIYAIRAHMGAFDAACQGGSRVIGNIFDKSKLAVCVHLADMAATNIIERS